MAADLIVPELGELFFNHFGAVFLGNGSEVGAGDLQMSHHGIFGEKWQLWVCSTHQSGTTVPHGLFCAAKTKKNEVSFAVAETITWKMSTVSQLE